MLKSIVGQRTSPAIADAGDDVKEAASRIEGARFLPVSSTRFAIASSHTDATAAAAPLGIRPARIRGDGGLSIKARVASARPLLRFRRDHGRLVKSPAHGHDNDPARWGAMTIGRWASLRSPRFWRSSSRLLRRMRSSRRNAARSPRGRSRRRLNWRRFPRSKRRPGGTARSMSPPPSPTRSDSRCSTPRALRRMPSGRTF